MKKRDCPRDIYNLIRSYLSDRTVEIAGSGSIIREQASRGCPQGSILGPSFWNLTFDDAIRTIENAGFHAVAYADNLAVVIRGSARKELEIKAI